MVAGRGYQSLVAASSNPEIALLRDRERRGEEAESVLRGNRRGKVEEDSKEEDKLWSWVGEAEEEEDKSVKEVRVCYYATGKQAQGFRACDSEAETSLCCPLGYTCLRDKALCVVTSHGVSTREDDSLDLIPRPELLVAACTEQEWDEDVCGSRHAQCLGQFTRVIMALGMRKNAKFGLTFSTKDSEGDQGKLIACRSDDGGDRRQRYCCERDYLSGACNCADGGGALTSDEGLSTSMIPVELRRQAPVTATPSLEAAELSSFLIDSTLTITIPTPTRTPTMTTTSSPSSTMADTTTTSSESSSTRDVGLTGIQTVVPTVVPTTPGTSSASNPHGTSLGVRLGLGLGIPFAIILIIAFVYYSHRRMRRRYRHMHEKKYPPLDFKAQEKPPINVADPAVAPRHPPADPRPPPRPPRHDDVDLELAATALGEAGKGPGRVIMYKSAYRPKIPENNSSHTSQLPQARWSWRRHREKAKEKEKEKAVAKESARGKREEDRQRRERRAEERYKARERRREKMRDVQIHQAVAYQAPSGPPAVPVTMLVPAPGAKPPSRKGKLPGEPDVPIQDSPPSLSNWPLPATRTANNQQQQQQPKTPTERENDRRGSKYFSPQHLYRQWEHHQQRQRQQQEEEEQREQQQEDQQRQPQQSQQQQQRQQLHEDPNMSSESHNNPIPNQPDREQRHPQPNLTVDTGQRPVGMDEISPLSSSGSAPYHLGRISAVSGMGYNLDP